jgi:cobyrinic acid a,c-diamide synthase
MTDDKTLPPKPSIIIAGTHSGCGKTTLTLGIMAALSARGVTVQPFKCGPDFIDPTLHQMVTGRASRNLDVRMCGQEFVKKIFSEHAPEDGITVIEGVMGLFDGGRGSAAYLAKLLDIAVILVIDVRSAAESVAAVVKGFETLDPKIRFAGVILNRVGSERHGQMIKETVKTHCQTKIIGSLAKDKSITIPSRHLGLHMGMESGIDTERLSIIIEENIELDCLLDDFTLKNLDQKNSQNKTAKQKSPPETTAKKSKKEKVKIGIAWDEAFCFYYIDNLDMLERAGAEIVLFSPIHDKHLPDDLSGIYLGGGYPELYAEKLSNNGTMREEIRIFSRAGKPVYGECGGFMYLTGSITDTKGNLYPMAGVYPVKSYMRERLRRLGYRRVEMMTDTVLGEAGSYCYGHEFHYGEIDEMDSSVKRAYTLDDGRREGYLIDRTLAGFVHLHWGRTPKVAERFVELSKS